MGLLGKKNPAETSTSREELVKMLEAAKSSTTQEPSPQSKPNPEKSLLGGSKMTDPNGITLDMGEGMSLVIPIERRMSLHDFLKIAEKVKKLELMQYEEEEEPKEEPHHHH